MPKLHITSPSSLARTFELTENLISIGRTTDNDVCIPEHNISKRHGVLVRAGNDYHLHDFNSTNGTFVNGEPIMAAKLKHGASIRFGPVELRYESAPASPIISATPSSAPEIKPAEQPGLMSSSGAGRGMTKRGKPEYSAGSLQPGSFAKPIPPPPGKTSDSVS